MNDQDSASPTSADAYEGGPLAPLTLRIGVTGHRPNKLANSRTEQLDSQVGRVLQDLYHETSRLLEIEEGRWLYETPSGRPHIRLISALAEGSDRIVVDRAVLDREFDFELVAALPFHREEYEQYFIEEGLTPAPLEAFTRDLDKADTVVELGGRRAEGDRAYERLGEFIVRQSDFLIAIWDPRERDPGRGGTLDVIRRAVLEGVTVICIDAREPHEITIRAGHHQSPMLPQSESTVYSSQLLETLLRKQLVFSGLLDEPDVDNDDDIKRRAAVRGRFEEFVAETGIEYDPSTQPDYVSHSPLAFERPRPWIWGHMFRAFVGFLAPDRVVQRQKRRWAVPDAGHAGREGRKPLPTGRRTPAFDRIFAAFSRADQLAVFYSDLHRSIFMTIYICGGLALCAAAAALYFGAAPIAGLEARYAFSVLELLLLAIVFLLWRADHKNRYHERWIEYRSVAEFLRPMIHLSLLGRTYPLNRLREQQEQVGRERLGHGGPAKSWVFMYVESVLRWAGVPAIRIDPDGDYLRACRAFVGANWFGEQLTYHTNNAARMHVLGTRLQWFSFWMFWGTALMVAVKLLNGFVLHAVSLDFVGLLAGVLPALGTIAFAIRNHAEFEISAQRSKSMRIRYRHWMQRLERTKETGDVDALVDLLDESAESALREASEWGEIYEVKVSETA